MSGKRPASTVPLDTPLAKRGGANDAGVKTDDADDHIMSF
jgi:hypothetical protein